MASPDSTPRPRSQPRVIDPVDIVLDKPRRLRMDFAAMKAFRQATGLSPWVSEVWDDPDPEVLAKLVWAALLWEEPNLTIAEVEAFPNMDMGNIGYISECVGSLWGATMPLPDETPANEVGDDASAANGTITISADQIEEPRPNFVNEQTTNSSSSTGVLGESISDLLTTNSGSSLHESSAPS